MGKPSLTRLVQQIGEIVAQGDDSGSQSQASDGGLRLRLRTVLLSLLDGFVGENAGKLGLNTDRIARIHRALEHRACSCRQAVLA